ncbi:tenascin-R [Austrofundulus limnaeus]|uniref:Tenascin-R n=1 Tax=Austrofundulus limnaeus TaxID=52670 RepID=A0A2I4CD71_AUSLI|nr:PREDICTED: tenascin-R-like [Austrofundulus limnaeus]
MTAPSPLNPEGFKASDQNESSITLQWNKVNNNVSFVLQFNNSDTNISSPDGAEAVTHTVSRLTAGTKYTFTLFSVFEDVRSSGVSLTAVTAPLNPEGFKASDQNESSITLQWNEVNNNVSFVLQFNNSDTNISSPDGAEAVTHTVSRLTAGTKYTFSLFSVFEDVRSSGVSLTAVTGPYYVLVMNQQFKSLTKLSETDIKDTMAELFRKYGLPPELSVNVLSVKPSVSGGKGTSSLAAELEQNRG